MSTALSILEQTLETVDVIVGSTLERAQLHVRAWRKSLVQSSPPSRDEMLRLVESGAFGQPCSGDQVSKTVAGI